MLGSSVRKSDYEVSSRLTEFDLSREDLIKVALAASAARNNASPLHPLNSAGTYSYHEGVAALRAVLLPKGWNMARPNNIEAVEHKKHRITIIFQNVDNACGLHDPRPTSRKGEGTRKFVDNPTGYLWDYMEDEDKSMENTHVWFLCVSVSGDELRAELSRPRSVDGDNFGLFLERIFIISDEGATDEFYKNKSSDSYEVQDFEINVSRKS